MSSSSAASGSAPLGRAFFDSLSNEQRQTLADMRALTDDERSAFVSFLISEAVGQCAGVPDAALARRKRRLDEGTGPAFLAFARRALEFEYISSQEHERVTARLSALPEEQREEAVVRAMRRFIAGMQPLGDNVVLVDCPVRHESHPGLDLNGIRVRCEGLPGGSPERYNVTIPIKGEMGKEVRGLGLHESDDEASMLLEAEVEPRYMRPAPVQHGCRDEQSHPIPEDQAAEAWFEKEVALYEKNLPLLLALGSQGVMRPK